MEIWDGYYRDGTYLLMQRSFEKPNYGGCFEVIAGGSALKGEDKLACVKRELYEETGIVAEEFRELPERAARLLERETKTVFANREK